jgi:flavodoxin
MRNNILIAYFSREGNNYFGGNIVNLAVGDTEVAAKIISKITGGDLFRIDPVKKTPPITTLVPRRRRENCMTMPVRN